MRDIPVLSFKHLRIGAIKSRIPKGLLGDTREWKMGQVLIHVEGTVISQNPCIDL